MLDTVLRTIGIVCTLGDGACLVYAIQRAHKYAKKQSEIVWEVKRWK